MTEEKFQLIGRYQYSSEAIVFKGKLESEGVETFVRDNHTVDSNPLYSNAVGGVKLFVRNEDLEKAQHILSQISTFSVDENNSLLKCPKCGAEQVEMVTSIQDLKTLIAFIFGLLVSIFPLSAKHKYKCQACKFEFKKPKAKT